MNEHDDAYVDAMLMVNMQANTRSVTPASPHPSDTFLSKFGTPTLLWRVLQSVGYTEPPQYSWWEVDMTGDLQWFAVQGVVRHMGAGLHELGGPATQMGRPHGKQPRLRPMLCCSTSVRGLVMS